MQKKRILQVTSCFQYGGTEAYIMNNFRNIDRDQFQFDFWFFLNEDSPYTNEIRSLGGNIYFGDLPHATKIIPLILNLVKHIKKNGPYDAVHAHINVANAWIIVAALIASTKIRISHSHATSGLDSNSIIKRIYFGFEKILIKSLATKKLSCSKEAGSYLYGEKYFLKHGIICKNGINIDQFFYVDKMKVDTLRNDFCLYDDSFVIGNITRFDTNKNQIFALAVFKEIFKVKPNAILILGGVDGGKLSYIKEKARALGIEGNVKFIGVRNDVDVCLHLMDLYLFPSINEGLGIVLLEAQAAGLTCITSTGVSKEIDVGLGLVHFLDLKEGVKFWAKYILNYSVKPKNTMENISVAFENKGYSIKSSVKRLEKIYEGEFKV